MPPQVVLLVLGLMLVPMASSFAPGTDDVRASASGCPSQAGWTRLASPQEVRRDQHELRGVPGTTSIAALHDSHIRLYATTTATGLMTSTDCGSTWTRVAPPRGWPDWDGLKALLLDRGNMIMLFYSGPHHISRDGGQSVSFGAVTGTSIHPGASYAAVSPDLPGVVYATFSPYGPGGVGGGGRSLDGGETWEWIPEWKAWHLIALGADADSLYLSGAITSLYTSNDGGKTYTKLAGFRSEMSALASADRGRRVWAALQDGSLLVSRDSGLTWSAVVGVPVDGYIRYLSPMPDEAGAVFVVGELGDIWLYRESALAAPLQN